MTDQPMNKAEFFRNIEGLSAGGLKDVAWRHYKRLEALERQLRDVRGLIEFHIRNSTKHGTTWGVLQAVKVAAALEDQPDEV